MSSPYTKKRGAWKDDGVIRKAHAENWILITADKDCGEMVHRQRRLHRGVVLLRLDDERAASKINTLRRLLEGHAADLADRFVVVTEERIRFARA